MTKLGCVSQAGSWEVSKRLAAHLQHFGIDPMHHQPAAQALCRLVSSRLHPLVKALYPSGVAGPSILDEEVRCGTSLLLPLAVNQYHNDDGNVALLTFQWTSSC